MESLRDAALSQKSLASRELVVQSSLSLSVMHLLDLPGDLLHAILRELRIADLEHMEQTCRSIAERDHTNLWKRHWFIAAAFRTSLIEAGRLPPVLSFVRTSGDAWTPDDDDILIFYYQSLSMMPSIFVDLHWAAAHDAMGRRRQKRTYEFLVDRISWLRAERLAYRHEGRLQHFKAKSLPMDVTCSACCCKGPHMCGKIPASARVYKQCIALHVTLSCDELIRAFTCSMGM